MGRHTAAQLLTPKKKNRKIERGEFITPPRPMGRRSNKPLTNICKIIIKIAFNFGDIIIRKCQMGVVCKHARL